VKDHLAKQDMAADSGLSVRTWERILASGEIAVTRVGRRVLVAREDYQAYMDLHRTEPVVADIRSQLEGIAARALRSRR
jgi:excisionase family DNA binding protein